MPETLFALLSFEGPDRYSQAGGLGTRMKELSRALARHGHETHLFFIGDPALPAVETRQRGRLILHRWGQWISAQHPAGVYDGEVGKYDDWNASLPSYLADELLAPAMKAGRRVVVMAEDWQTAASVVLVDRALRMRDLRDRAVLVWNANNVFGNWRIDWPTLDEVATITTVSRYMKVLLWREGVNPIVIPNGIPKEAMTPPRPADVVTLREGGAGDLFLFKIGRFDPDKRWLMAMTAVARLKREGVRVRMLIRGDRGPHGAEVLAHARTQGLVVADVRGAEDAAALSRAMRAHPDADLLNLVSFLPESLIGTIYFAADAVLANSGHEPFGLVGLEVMAAGGVAVTGSTGEDYAEPFRNSLVLETDDPAELVEYLQMLRRDQSLGPRLRRAGRATARAYLWDAVIPQLFARLELAEARQAVRRGPDT
ncbi:MAG TPA: glycosyltransferase family 4 protein [Candidatus Dormibacteraeota bacterium]|nr:glycosyltransferase family 4 protein [Candidatus Dormibacteraeota bacterium]